MLDERPWSCVAVTIDPRARSACPATTAFLSGVDRNRTARVGESRRTSGFLPRHDLGSSHRRYPGHPTPAEVGMADRSGARTTREADMLNALGMTTLVGLALGAFVASTGRAQATELPFGVGERLRYRVSVGKLGTIGEGVMSVDGPVDVRGTPTLVLRSEIHARVGLIKTTERAESWIDPTRMAALRYQKRNRGHVRPRGGTAGRALSREPTMGGRTREGRTEPDQRAAR